MFRTDQNHAELSGVGGRPREPLPVRGSVRLPELLAPAGERESLIAAVQNGADAVYLGGKAFSARMSAPNFDDRQLRWAIDYCHVRGVRVHCAVNTLLLPDELEEAVRFVASLYQYGVDAVIVQDLGLAAVLRRLMPDLPLHASTQMTLHNLAGVEAAEALGVRRVILARELTLGEIALIRNNTAMELETFVHGALCICYSGQCLMSSLIGARSGNRGACAQPCRLAYGLADVRTGLTLHAPREGEHLLSPKDLTMLPNLADLIASGVDGFKIEGRMRRPEYVAVVVAAFRRALDRWAEGRRENLVTPEEQLEVAQVFNRGFCPGYFYGNPGPGLMSFARPNNRGVLLGRVTASKPGLLWLRLDGSAPALREGDGIEAWVSRGGRVAGVVTRMTVDGRRVGEATGGSTVCVTMEGAEAARPGDRVFKTLDAALMRRARATFAGRRDSNLARQPVEVRARLVADSPLEVTLSDRDGNVVTVVSADACPAAETSPTTAESLARQLDRFGNTPFLPTGFSIEVKPSRGGRLALAPASLVNKVRRDATAALELARQEAHRRRPVPDEALREVTATAGVGAEVGERACRRREVRAVAVRLAVSVGSWPAARAAVEAGADDVYLCVESMGHAGSGGRPPGRCSMVEEWAEGMRQVRQAVGAATGAGRLLLWVALPRIQKTAELEEDAAFLEALARAVRVDGVVAGNLGMLAAVERRTARRADVDGGGGRVAASSSCLVACDIGLNVFNRFTLDALGRWGADRVAASPELTLGQARRLVQEAAGLGLEVELLVHGRLPMMVSEHCVLGGPGQACGAGWCPSGMAPGVSSGRPQPQGELRGGTGRVAAFLVDRVGARFPVAADSRCRTHILNSVDLCMLDHLEELLADPAPGAVRVEARFQQPEYVRTCVSAYRRAQDLIASGDVEAYRRYAAETARGVLEALSPGGLTRGHYFRGVRGQAPGPEGGLSLEEVGVSGGREDAQAVGTGQDRADACGAHCVGGRQGTRRGHRARD